jgi:hypothetical protein
VHESRDFFHAEQGISREFDGDSRELRLERGCVLGSTAERELGDIA